MEEKNLLKFALATAVMGLIALFTILQTSELEETKISDLSQKTEEDTVKIIGYLEKVISKENITIIELSQKQILKAVLFEQVNLTTGSKVSITGKISNYQGEKELIIEKLELI